MTQVSWIGPQAQASRDFCASGNRFIGYDAVIGNYAETSIDAFVVGEAPPLREQGKTGL